MSSRSKYIIRLLELTRELDNPELKVLVNKLIRERDYLEDIASIDPLTGLYNRRILTHIRECSAIVMCDIDSFKKINDRYGHDEGDRIIKIVSQIIKKNVRVNDYVCRYGGDEFFIAFVNCPEEVVLDRLELIRSEVEETVELPDVDDSVTLSIGVAMINGTDTIDELRNKADSALYKSKNAGKNQITKFEIPKVLIRNDNASKKN